MKSVLLVKGDQGSGKTEFAAFLILLRKLLLNHELEVCDPHGHQNADRWFNCELYGSNYNYKEIANRLAAYYQRLQQKNKKSTPRTTVWDEFTNYSARCPSGAADDFVLSILSDTRKAAEYPVLISHNEAKGGLGGGSRSGFAEMKKSALVVIHLIADRDDFGEPRPALRGTITNLEKDADGESVTFPIDLESWMRPSWLLQHFPELNQPPVKSTQDSLSEEFHKLIRERGLSDE